jgi:hypothetical protein
MNSRNCIADKLLLPYKPNPRSDKSSSMSEERETQILKRMNQFGESYSEALKKVKS